MPPQRTPTRITSACNGCRNKKQKVSCGAISVDFCFGGCIVRDEGLSLLDFMVAMLTVDESHSFTIVLYIGIIFAPKSNVLTRTP